MKLHSLRSMTLAMLLAQYLPLKAPGNKPILKAKRFSVMSEIRYSLFCPCIKN